MTEIREIQINSIAEPCSVKLERGQKGGYGYELGIHAETMPEALNVIVEAKKRIEALLYGADVVQ